VEKFIQKRRTWRFIKRHWVF